MWRFGVAWKWRSNLPFSLGRTRVLLSAALLAAATVGCGHKAPPHLGPGFAPALQGDVVHPNQTSGWVDTKLYFGLGPADHPEQGVSEAQWREFLDREVTPRFPDGLSVQDVYGQWRGKGQAQPQRERSKVLIIDYRNSADNQVRVEAIRAAWKKMTGDESVLRVTALADVSF